MARRICMLVMNDVVSDARVQRTARSAAAAGHTVHVLGLRSDRAPSAVEARDGYTIVRLDERGPLPDAAAIANPSPAVQITTPTASHTVVEAVAESAPTPSTWRRFQAIYDERVTFAIRRNRVYQVLNTYDKRMRRAVKRATARAAGDLPDLLRPFEHLLADVSRWEVTSRHMADHDAIRRDVFVLGRRMAELAARLEADVCHCNDLDTLAAGCWARTLRPMRVIYDAHELWTEQHSPAASRQHHTDAYFDFFERLLAALAPHVDAVVTVNPSIGLVLQSRTGCPSPLVVWNCPAWQQAEPWSGALRERAAGRRIVLLHGGLIDMDRGLDELITAVPHFQDTLLVMRGSGNARAALERRVTDGGLQDRVCFVDPVPLADVITSAAEADVGIIPYKPTSINNLLSSPNKLFEYMMAGLALAVSDLPELRRVVEGDDLGVTFNPCVPADIARAVNGLLADSERLARCRENARRAARERYHWEAVSRDLLALYD